MPNTVRFHRVLRATPERVYRAFLDPDAVVKWLPPNGFTGNVHHLDAQVGGTCRMSFTLSNRCLAMGFVAMGFAESDRRVGKGKN